jgi:hypothetical protein
MWWVHLIFIALGAAITLFLHEFSHVVMCWANGLKVHSFKPYPHKADGKWYFGRITRDRTDDIEALQQINISPLVKGIGMAVIWGIAGIFYHPLWWLGAWEIIDCLWWWKGYFFSPTSDGGKWRKNRENQ